MENTPWTEHDPESRRDEEKPWTGSNDKIWGTKWVYCHSHGRVHSTGWCGVSLYKKVPLLGETIEQAWEEFRWRKQQDLPNRPFFWVYNGNKSY